MATLDKFGVPFNNSGPNFGRNGILQPKLKYRFRVRTVNFGPLNRDQINLTQQVMNVTKPQMTHEEVMLDVYNSKVWVAGKHTWNPITLVVRDDITNAVNSLVSHQLQKQLNHFEQTSPAAGVNYKFLTSLEILDGGNLTIFEQWTLEGCWIQDVNYDTMDYAASEVQMITMVIRFDNATLSETLMPNPPENSAGDAFTGIGGNPIQA